MTNMWNYEFDVVDSGYILPILVVLALERNNPGRGAGGARVYVSRDLHNSFLQDNKFNNCRIYSTA